MQSQIPQVVVVAGAIVLGILALMYAVLAVLLPILLSRINSSIGRLEVQLVRATSLLGKMEARGKANAKPREKKPEAALDKALTAAEAQARREAAARQTAWLTDWEVYRNEVLAAAGGEAELDTAAEQALKHEWEARTPPDEAARKLLPSSEATED